MHDVFLFFDMLFSVVNRVVLFVRQWKKRVFPTSTFVCKFRHTPVRGVRAPSREAPGRARRSLCAVSPGLGARRFPAELCVQEGFALTHISTPFYVVIFNLFSLLLFFRIHGFFLNDARFLFFVALAVLFSFRINIIFNNIKLKS